jgi:hypothetical protein
MTPPSYSPESQYQPARTVRRKSLGLTASLTSCICAADEPHPSSRTRRQSARGMVKPMLLSLSLSIVNGELPVLSLPSIVPQEHRGDWGTSHFAEGGHAYSQEGRPVCVRQPRISRVVAMSSSYLRSGIEGHDTRDRLRPKLAAYLNGMVLGSSAGPCLC